MICLLPSEILHCWIVFFWVRTEWIVRLFLDAAWFDSTSALDSECDEEFYSVYDGEWFISSQTFNYPS